MSPRLHVANLPPAVTPEVLQEIFGEDGRRVTAVQLLPSRIAGNTKSHALVEMASVEDAQAAIRALDGVDLDGFALRVGRAREDGRREDDEDDYDDEDPAEMERLARRRRHGPEED